jgi:hypothetical protein
MGWLWTLVLPISASWVARIVGVSHGQQAIFSCFDNRIAPAPQEPSLVQVVWVEFIVNPGSWSVDDIHIWLIGLVLNFAHNLWLKNGHLTNISLTRAN